jgi:hypothetical protein
MSTRALLLGLLLAAFVATSAAEAGETYFTFKITSREELSKLTKIVSIDQVKDGQVFAYANDDELARFRELGYAYEVLPNPSSLVVPEMATDKADIQAWDVYPTYSQYVAMMNQFETNYPGLCDVQTIGTTVQGRALLVAKISDNVGVEEDEPEVLYVSTMHGDEATGYVLMLRLIDSLLVSYGSDTRITDMVDNMEIWINPNHNPDGTYHGGDNTVSGAWRYNANSVDLNRNFPDPQDGQHPDGYAWQVETVAMMNFAIAHNFVISANFHGGAEVVNYPWDTWSTRHADDSWWIDISRAYADTVHVYGPSGYMTDLNNGITDGWDWYEVDGGRQDYMTYFRGGREVTIEISSTKLPSGSSLPSYWQYNKRSLLQWLENAGYGIRGIVTDAVTDLPVAAMVTVLNHDVDSAQVFTDPAVGDYHRMIDAGTWNLRFSALGYVSQTINNIVATDGGTTRIDVELEPLSEEPVLDFQSQNAGDIQPGDAASMYITLINSGGGDATGVSGTLETDESYVTITQDYSTFPIILELGGQGTSNSAYQLTVSPSCPLYHEANFNLVIAADGGYEDTVTFAITVGRQVEDFETGGFAKYPWQMAGNQPWTLVTSGAYEGAYSAKSGTIGNSQSSTMQMTLNVISAGNITFFYKVSSESGYDYLVFYIDGVSKGSWSGSVGWIQGSYPVTAGSHTFKWTYSKDGSEVGGSDCAWVDYIVLPQSSAVLNITTTSLPGWTAGIPYSQQLVATGGYGTKTWSDLYNNLTGTGLTLSGSGLLSGTPAAGLVSFTAHVEDQGGSSDNQLLSFMVAAAPNITTLTLPDWTAGRPYSQQLQVVGGTGTKTWSDLNNDLTGTGLSLTPGGLLSGTPINSGQIAFTARVQDQVGATDDQPLTVMINAAPQITTSSMPDGTTGVSYSVQLESAGGTGTKTWTDVDTSLSGSGLTLSSTGLVSGTPTQPGTVNFTAKVTDQAGATAQQQLPISIFAGWVCGDANASGDVDIDDVVYLIGYVFASGPAPVPEASGDANCSGDIDIDDIVYLIQYIFGGGPVPCAEC